MRATHTLTFLAHKPGLHTGDGPDYCGERRCCDDLGAGERRGGASRTGALLTPAVVAPWLAPRARDSHKGDFGTLGIVGGDRGMVGAALLAGARRAARGAGKVRVGLHRDRRARRGPRVSRADAAHARRGAARGGAGRRPRRRAAPATSASMFERAVLPARDRRASRWCSTPMRSTRSRAARRCAPRWRHARAPTHRSRPIPPRRRACSGSRPRRSRPTGVAAALALARALRCARGAQGRGQRLRLSRRALVDQHHRQPGPRERWHRRRARGHRRRAALPGARAAARLAYAVCLHGAAADSLVARGVGPVGLTARRSRSKRGALDQPRGAAEDRPRATRS